MRIDLRYTPMAWIEKQWFIKDLSSMLIEAVIKEKLKDIILDYCETSLKNAVYCLKPSQARRTLREIMC